MKAASATLATFGIGPCPGNTPSGVSRRMEKLGEADFRRILAAIEILASDSGDATFPRRAVDAIATAIEVDLVCYNEVDPATGSTRFVLRPSPEDFEAGSREYQAFVRRFGNHPFVAFRLAGQNQPAPFLSRLRLLGMLGNCCGEAELRLNMGLTLSETRSRLIGISVNRSVRDFDDLDSAKLDALRPHVVAAYRNAIRSKPDPTPATATPALTRRESEVIYWVAMGKTNEEVGTIIGARPMTVKKHLEHIYDKLGVPNRMAAVRMMRPALPARG